jgi:hypothetical protein
MNPQIAALRIARSLTATETEIDRAIAQTAGLTSEMVSASLATGMPAASGHAALAFVSAAQAKLVEARRQMILAHEGLRRLAETADTPVDCPDSDSAFTSAEFDGKREAA